MSLARNLLNYQFGYEHLVMWWREMYFRVIVECGHVGAGKSFEAVRYWQAKSTTHALSSASGLPRAKRKNLTVVKSVVPITRREYDLGLREEASNPYLMWGSRPFEGTQEARKAS